jgi:hypothetical protein
MHHSRRKMALRRLAIAELRPTMAKMPLSKYRKDSGGNRCLRRVEYPLALAPLQLLMLRGRLWST